MCVAIGPKSEEIIREVYNRYEEVQSLGFRLDGHTVIHVYPTEDTYRGDDLHGLMDSLFFDAWVFNNGKKCLYRWHDQITFDVKPSFIRIFKDGSTMITIDEPIIIFFGQSMNILPGRKF